MNRYASTVALYARMNLIKVLVITLVTAVAVAFLIWRFPVGQEMQETSYIDPETQEAYVVQTECLGLDDVMGNSHVSIVCGVGFAAIVVVMSLTGCGYGVKTDYTVRRLRVNERGAVWLWTVYHAALLIIYWAVLAAVLLGMLTLRSGDVAGTAGMEYGPQSMLLLCYTDTFLHRLIPVRDFFAWVIDIVLVLVTALGTVRFSYCQRHGSFSIGVLLAVGCTVGSCFCPMGNSWNYILLILSLMLGGTMCYLMWGGEEDAEKPL